MKTICLLLILIAPTVYGQIIDEIPSRDNEVYFSAVLEFNNTPKDVLYKEARFAFLESEGSIMQESVEAGELLTSTHIKNSFTARYYIGYYNVDLEYKIKVSVKDNRIKVDLYEVYFHTENAQRNGKDRLPAEEFFAKEKYYKKNGTAKGTNFYYKDAMLDIWKQKEAYYKDTIAKRLKNRSEDW